MQESPEGVGCGGDLRFCAYSAAMPGARLAGAGGLAIDGDACECRGRVSWIVFACLFGYVSLRCALWVRGQVRLVLLRDSLPVGPQPSSRPRHLSAGLGLLLDRNFAGRVELMASTRTIATVLITDPDVPLGCVRDFRYRLAVARAWTAACAWVRTLEELADEDRVCLERAGYTGRGFLDHHAWLHRCVRTTVRARALEPFEVAEVEATCSRVAAMADELAEVERALARGSEDPYR